jgi:hypothetical protein
MYGLVCGGVERLKRHTGNICMLYRSALLHTPLILHFLLHEEPLHAGKLKYLLGRVKRGDKMVLGC